MTASRPDTTVVRELRDHLSSILQENDSLREEIATEKRRTELLTAELRRLQEEDKLQAWIDQTFPKLRRDAGMA